MSRSLFFKKSLEMVNERLVNVACNVAGDTFEMFLKSAQLAYTIPIVDYTGDDTVVGIATIGDELFVLQSSATMLVYNPSVDTVYRRNLNVAVRPNYGHNYGYDYSFRGLAACEFHQCLYVSEEYTQAICKVSPVTNNVVKQWSANGQPFGLSVNSVHNLLVACHNSHKVQEFTTDGTIVREIDLQPSGITCPTHVVQLPDGNLGITHQGSEHGYSVVGSDGKIVKSTKGPAGNAAGQMKSPFGFAVSKGRKANSWRVKDPRGIAAGQMNSPFGFAVSKRKVLVVDYGNNRLLLLNSESMSFEQLPPSFNVGFNQPRCIHFDASAGVMYVGEYSGGRVFGFKK